MEGKNRQSRDNPCRRNWDDAGWTYRSHCLLRAWSDGDQAAFDRLATLVYQDLLHMARRYMKNERAGNTLQTTALANEAYLRLVDVKNAGWRILVDAARARGAHKRGAGAVKVDVEVVDLSCRAYKKDPLRAT